MEIKGKKTEQRRDFENCLFQYRTNGKQQAY